MRLRAPQPTDAESLGQICFDAFGAITARHGYPNNMPTVEFATSLLRRITTSPNMEGIVAEEEGRPVGSAFLWIDGSVGGIGPVIVDPAAQDAGVGRRMMEWLVARGDELGLRSQRLTQGAFHGRSLALYSKLGFDVREPLAPMSGEPRGLGIAGKKVRRMTEGDLAEANALCERVHGHSRAGELSGAVSRGEATAAFTEGRLTGYATAIGTVGHAVGESNEDLMALIDAAESIAGSVLIPTRNSDLFHWCLAQGFRIQYPRHPDVPRLG